MVGRKRRQTRRGNRATRRCFDQEDGCVSQRFVSVLWILPTVVTLDVDVLRSRKMRIWNRIDRLTDFRRTNLDNIFKGSSIAASRPARVVVEPLSLLNPRDGDPFSIIVHCKLLANAEGRSFSNES